MSRVSRKMKADCDAWNARALAQEPIIRLILDGTVALGAAKYSHIYINHMLGSWLGKKAPGYRSIRNLKAMIEPLRLRRPTAAFGTDYLHSVTDASIDRSESILWTNMGDVIRRLPTRLRTSERNHCGMRGRGS